jgi:ubiquinone/menaquinone biosynthesis C-methylase UbiE
MHNPLIPLVYDRVVRGLEEGGLAARRRALLADATGWVLEVGAGTGLNLPHYPEHVTRLVLADPNPGMRRRLRARAESLGREVEVVDAVAERLPFLENTFDEAVTTLTLCSVDERVTSLHEIRRVLRPRGRLRFLEHVAATAAGPSRLQRVVCPFHRALAGGCRLDLVMTAALAEAHFEVEWIEDWALPVAPPWARPAVVGVARAPG